MRLLTRSDVQQSISMREAVDVVKRAFIELSTGRADVPLRIALSQPKRDGDDLRPGAHVNGVGSYKPEMQEIDCVTLRRASKIVVDSREAAMAEAGDLIVAIERGEIQPSDIYAEIGEIAAGLKPGRQDDDEITYFKSVGNAAQDAAVAQAIYQRALQEDLGIEIDLSK